MPNAQDARYALFQAHCLQAACACPGCCSLPRSNSSLWRELAQDPWCELAVRCDLDDREACFCRAVACPFELRGWLASGLRCAPWGHAHALQRKRARALQCLRLLFCMCGPAPAAAPPPLSPLPPFFFPGYERFRSCACARGALYAIGAGSFACCAWPGADPALALPALALCVASLGSTLSSLSPEWSAARKVFCGYYSPSELGFERLLPRLCSPLSRPLLAQEIRSLAQSCPRPAYQACDPGAAEALLRSELAWREKAELAQCAVRPDSRAKAARSL